MIIDSLHHTASYSGLGPRFVRGFAWLASFSPATPDGRHDVEGDDIYALVQSYQTSLATEKKFESHRRYADIQYIVAGREIIYYAPVEGLQSVTAYDATRDYELYADPAASIPLPLGAGTFSIFFPQDAHKPCCVDGERCAVRKVVIKVRV